MDERFVSALENAFPERDVADSVGEEPDVNERNGTVCVEFDDGQRVFCKMKVDGDAWRLESERAVIEYVDAHADVPVPSVLACDPDAPVPYLVTAPMAGDPLSDITFDPDGPDEVTAMQALGRSLAKIHAQRFDTHGDVTGWSDGALDVDARSWTAVFVDQMETIREMAHSDRFERYVDDVVEALEANRELLDAAPAAIVHNDPHWANCYYHEGDVGLLDWEFAHVGDPARDLHRVLEQQFGLFRPEDPDEQVEALHAGYREQAGGLPEGYADREPIYEVVRLLGASAFFDGKAEECAESRAEVADWMDAEMELRLDAIR